MSTFFAKIFRMKYINRWSLMRNTVTENVSQHSLEVAIIAHALAVIGNTYNGRSYNADRIASQALFHDMSEVLTGDLPTPIKYANSTLCGSYKELEEKATAELISTIPCPMQEEYTKLVTDMENERIIKAADTIAALIKCTEEVQNGNKEFERAYRATRQKVYDMAMGMPEIRMFIEEFLPAFSKSLDEL